MDKIILIPLIISAALLITRETKDVFILVFLPCLMLLPSYFEVELARGTPELYFWSAALIPILVAWALKNFEGFRFQGMDFIILAYILVIFYGQWINSDYKKAQKILFNNMMAIYFPYAIVRAFCTDRDTLIRIIRTITFLGAFIAVFNMWEFRMFTNYFDEILRRIWPHSVMWDIGMVLQRWGFKRALGPFSHPIVAGYIFALSTPLAIWCYFQGHYRNKHVGRLTMLLNAGGLLVSLSRAPILGFFMGLLIIYYGWSQNRAAIMSVVLIVGTIILLLVIPKFIEYASVTPATAKTADQRNVAYRKQMWDAYREVVMQRPYLGWGRFTVPSVKGMKSIDSEYLGVALASGLMALGLYVTFLLGILIKLFRFARARSHTDPEARLAWCLIAGWISAIFSQATVYSGAQSVQMLFMLAGVSQIVILMSAKAWRSPAEQVSEVNSIGQGFSFIRVI